MPFISLFAPLLLAAVPALLAVLCGATLQQGSLFDVSTATRGFLLSRTTTCANNEILSWNCGESCQRNPTFEPYMILDVSTSAGTFTYIGVDHTYREIIVAFRASDNVKNWLANLNFFFVPYPKENGDCPGDCKVHKGFLASYQSLQTTLRLMVSQLRTKFPTYQLLITGHSLGGALAELCGLDFASYKWPATPATCLVSGNENVTVHTAGALSEDRAKSATRSRFSDSVAPSPSSVIEDYANSFVGETAPSVDVSQQADTTSRSDDDTPHSNHGSSATSGEGSLAPSSSSELRAGERNDSSDRSLFSFSSSSASLPTSTAAATPSTHSVVVRVYSYGAPRVGNVALTEWATQLLWDDAHDADGSRSLSRLFRVTHAKDPVPHLPPLLFGYRHPATEIYYKKTNGGNLSSFTRCADDGSREDPRCSLGVLANKPYDHMFYMGMCAQCNCSNIEKPESSFQLSWPFFFDLTLEYLSNLVHW